MINLNARSINAAVGTFLHVGCGVRPPLIIKPACDDALMRLGAVCHSGVGKLCFPVQEEEEPL